MHVAIVLSFGCFNADVAEQVFNQCSISNETKDGKIWRDSKDYTITFDYEFIEDFQDAPRDFFWR